MNDLRKLTASVHAHRADGSVTGVLSNVTIVDARINANLILEAADHVAYAVIRDDDGTEEVMHRVEDPDGLPRLPLADIGYATFFFSTRPQFRHTPIAALLRHFQMAGAVDQDVVERLASTMRLGFNVATNRKFVLDFLYGSAILTAHEGEFAERQHASAAIRDSRSSR